MDAARTRFALYAVLPVLGLILASCGADSEMSRSAAVSLLYRVRTLAG